MTDEPQNSVNGDENSYKKKGLPNSRSELIEEYHESLNELKCAFEQNKALDKEILELKKKHKPIQSGYYNLQKNLSVMDFLLDALGKTIVVGGFRYLALHTDNDLINGLSIFFMTILSYYITLKLADMVWIPLGFSLLDGFALSDRRKTIVTVLFSFSCFFVVYWIIQSIIQILAKTKF